ncbi:hypothetical protein PILCRDRAFT_820709 [Piloderma croceum F 1598]|uniref:Thioredoxin n=1 Tax=Piloderma croceum (strain F 1598) TaxID=765440 RepID=A0A0C3FCH9_PILCF|nr:hypothetical protein PILCRDRAFT_820709 [Piloderma croceum F 1598]
MIEYIKSVEEFDSIIAKAKEANKVVLVDYTASWCGPCRMISPILDKLAGAADPNRIEFYKVDVDETEEISARAGVTAMPTFHAYNSKSPNPGHDYAEMRGAVPKKLEQFILDSLNGPASD